MLYSKTAFLFFLIVVSAGSCKKYLDEPTSKSNVIPTTLKDVEAMLDYYEVHSSGCALTEAGADNYYIKAADWQFYLSQQNSYDCFNYIWEGNISDPSWYLSYTNPIYHSNVVLSLLPGISSTDKKAWDNVKGSALFYRAYAFWQIAQIYCRPYTSTAAADPGIPLRLSPVIEEKSVRSSVQRTYDQIIGDLNQSLNLVAPIPLAPSRPGKAAVYGVLARVYLSMREYDKAGLYADSTLLLQSALMDYNTLSPTANKPVPPYPNNPELVWENSLFPNVLLSATVMKVDTTLYRSYANNDLRKPIYFTTNIDGTYRFQGSYGFLNNAVMFDGIATDEMYLIRAESLARSGQTAKALDDLNALMQKRWKNTAWTPFTATDAQDALQKILTERRKELCFRGLRWSDIRRLNLENANISIKRDITGMVYNLPPNDAKSVYLIPQEVITRSGMQQNLR